MEQQPKISRSKARHLRRKKLVIARRVAENDSPGADAENNEEVEEKHLRNRESEIGENVRATASLIKSQTKTLTGEHDLKQESRSQKVSSPHSSFSESEKKENKINLAAGQNLNQGLSDLLKETKEHSLKTDYNDTFFSTLEDIVAKLNSIPLPSSGKLSGARMNPEEKTREQVKAEREAKKAAKAAAKNKAKADQAADKKPVPEKSPKESKVKTKDAKVKSKDTKVASKESETKTGLDYDSMKKELEDIKKELDMIQFPNSVPMEDLPKKVPKAPEEKSAAHIQAMEVPKAPEEKSKAQLKAERRAKQEAQRAAKQEQADKKKPKPIQKVETRPQISEPVKKPPLKIVAKENLHEVNLFKHLYHEREITLGSVSVLSSKIHPEIMKLGIKYANKIIVGSNARCVALLQAVKYLVEDFERPSQADFTRGLEASLQDSAIYLHHCRPLAVSMQNALKHLKWQMSLLPATISDHEAKVKLGSAIDTYIQEQILLADKAISIKIQTKISNGDVILTYGFSSLIHKILCDAHTAGQQFQVVVVDGRPWYEGKELLKRLVKHGIECSYILIHALSFIMPKVSKVFLGAHAILANGSVMSRAGTAQIALMAKAFNVPVLVACETHKSCERAQTDSIVYNEIGAADALTETFLNGSKKSSLANWKAKKFLNLLNITYDVTPADLVTAVVTELAILPPSSVPVILRIKPSEI